MQSGEKVKQVVSLPTTQFRKHAVRFRSASLVLFSWKPLHGPFTNTRQSQDLPTHTPLRHTSFSFQSLFFISQSRPSLFWGASVKLCAFGRWTVEMSPLASLLMPMFNWPVSSTILGCTDSGDAHKPSCSFDDLGCPGREHANTPESTNFVTHYSPPQVTTSFALPIPLSLCGGGLGKKEAWQPPGLRSRPHVIAIQRTVPFFCIGKSSK